jgi:DNA-binding response OmpR family regulator
MLQELIEEPLQTAEAENNSVIETNKSGIIDKLTSDLPAMLIVDDNAEIRSYIKQIFDDTFNMYEAEDGDDGYELLMRETPDIVISDIKMKKMDGIELCSKIKNNPSVAHIPVILLTASSSDEIKLKGIEGGAEDYITKPFDKDIIIARVQNILKGRNRLQQYFFSAITLKPATHVAGEHKEFIERCIEIVEEHIDNPDFTVNMFCKAIGMSHPALYKKVKAVSGLTVNVFVRYIRLRKAAELLITTNKTITEVAYITGFNDIRYFREQFYELFKINPSAYIKSYRKVLGKRAMNQ